MNVREVDVRGYIELEDFEHSCFRKDFGYGERLCVHHADLDQIERIIPLGAYMRSLGLFWFDEFEPRQRDYSIDDGTNSYLKAFLAWATRRREAKRAWYTAQGLQTPQAKWSKQ